MKVRNCVRKWDGKDGERTHTHTHTHTTAIDNHDNTGVGLDMAFYFFGDLMTVIVVIVIAIIIVITLKLQIDHNKHTSQNLHITGQYSYKVMTQTVSYTYILNYISLRHNTWSSKI